MDTVVLTGADIRQQLSDELKCLDLRVDAHVSLLAEIQDFYRRRSEVELEYSRGLDKLVRQIMARHKTEKQKSVTHISYTHTPLHRQVADLLWAYNLL